MRRRLRWQFALLVGLVVGLAMGLLRGGNRLRRWRARRNPSGPFELRPDPGPTRPVVPEKQEGPRLEPRPTQGPGGSHSD
jgi:hypothetical protein